MDTETEEKEDDFSEPNAAFKMILYADTAAASASTWHALAMLVLCSMDLQYTIRGLSWWWKFQPTMVNTKGGEWGMVIGGALVNQRIWGLREVDYGSSISITAIGLAVTTVTAEIGEERVGEENDGGGGW